MIEARCRCTFTICFPGLEFFGSFGLWLTLEQHRFELHRSAHTQIFFNKYTVGPVTTDVEG